MITTEMKRAATDAVRAAVGCRAPGCDITDLCSCRVSAHAAIAAVAPMVWKQALNDRAVFYEHKAKELYDYLQTPSPDDQNWTGIMADQERRKRREMDACLRVYMEEAAYIRAMGEKP